MNAEEMLRRLQKPQGCVDMALDTDAYNEIDDQFAIAYALKSPDRMNVKAIYAAPFFNQKSSGAGDGMRKSYDEILHVLRIAGREDLFPEVYKGSEQFMRDEKTPVDSPAARALIKLSQNYSAEKPLYVVAIGAITNVASALLMDHSLADRIVLVWLGGHAWHLSDTREFNMMQDVAAARIVFGCGVPLVQLPCMGVVDRFYTTKPELENWLKGKNPLCDYLATNTIAEAESYAAGKPWSRVIWDVTAVAWLLGGEGEFMRDRIDYSPIPQYDDHYSFDKTRSLMRYVYYINRDALIRDLFEKLSV